MRWAPAGCSTPSTRPPESPSGRAVLSVLIFACLLCAPAWANTRFGFGTYTQGEGDAAVTRPLRGGIAPSVGDGPQIRGCNAEQKAAVKALQGKLYP